MNNNEVIKICQQLTQQGKEPTVALIKPRLSQKLPMPQIIAGIKQWRAQPNQQLPMAEQAATEQQSSMLPLAQRVTLLEQEVNELKQVIKQLTAGSER